METQIEKQNQNTNTFTFMYCMMHDDGFIIQGNHDYVPEGYVMQHSTQCEVCDWCNMGVIDVNNNKINIIKTLRLDYDRYGGGFIFRLYLGTLTDDKGNSINFDNDDNEYNEDDFILYKWIEHIYDSIIYTHTITSEFLEPKI